MRINRPFLAGSVLCALGFLAAVWISAFITRDVELTKVWWGAPYFITALVVHIALFAGAIIFGAFSTDERS